MNVAHHRDVTGVIVTRNTCAFTCAAIRSVEESRGGLSTEVVVVDNGSTDDTGVALARDFPAAKYIRSATNLGFARANNLGAKGSTAEFILLLNSDARLKTDSLATAVAWLRAHPECGIVGAQLLNPDGSRQNSIANFPTLATELLNKSLLRRLFPRRFPGKEQHYDSAVEVETVIGAFMLIRGDLWRALGGFDERYFFFFEETDFCLQVRRRGAKIFHLPQIEVWHEQGGSAKTVFVGARIEYWRSRYFYFRKNHGGAARVFLGVGLGVKLLVDTLSSALLTLLTLGRSPRWRNQWTVNSSLWRWHLCGCPEAMGIPR